MIKSEVLDFLIIYTMYSTISTKSLDHTQSIEVPQTLSKTHDPKPDLATEIQKFWGIEENKSTKKKKNLYGYVRYIRQ